MPYFNWPCRHAVTLGASALVTLACCEPSLAQTAGSAPPESVIVTVTRSATPLADVPESTSIVTADQIADTPAQGLDDILRDLPGLTLTDIGPDAGHPTAYNEGMRGLPTTETRMLVMVDGVPLTDPFFGYIQWNRIALDDIDRVEIVRGGGSPLWGNTAMGGVVNVITAAPASDTLTAEAGGGSYGSYTSSVYGSTAAADGLRLSMNVSFTGTAGYQTTPASWTSFGTLNVRSPVYAPTQADARNYSGRADFAPGGGLTGFAVLTYNEDTQTLQTPIGLDHQRTWTGGAGVTQALGNDASLTVTFFHDDDDFLTNNPHLLTFTTEYNSNIHTTTAADNGASLIFTENPSGMLKSFTLGADMHQISGADHADYFLPSGALAAPTITGGGDQLFLAGFAQATIVPFDALQIMGSLRYQYYLSSNGVDNFPPGYGAIPDVTKERLTPRVDALYHLDSDFALRGAYYQSFRAPTLDQLYRTYADTTAGIFEGNPFLLPESLSGGEIGLDFTRPGLRSQFTLYDTTINNLITQENLQPTDYPDLPGVDCGYDPATFTFLTCTKNINAASAIARGFEAEITWDISSGFSTELTYTYADSHYTANAADPTAAGERLEGVPMHNAGASLTYLDAAGWQITTVLRYLSKSYGDAHPSDGLVQDAHFVVDASASYPLTQRIKAYLTIQNLLNRHYIANNGGGAPILGTPFDAMAGLRVRFD